MTPLCTSDKKGRDFSLRTPEKTDFMYCYYDSNIALFLSVDPLSADYVAWSPYNYVMGNPVILIDPDGRSPVWIPSIDENNNLILTAEAGDNY